MKNVRLFMCLIVTALLAVAFGVCWNTKPDSPPMSPTQVMIDQHDLTPEHAAFLKQMTADLHFDSDAFHFTDEQRLIVQRVVFAEAGYEPASGQYLTATIVLNRIRQHGFTDAIYKPHAFASVTDQSKLWKQSADYVNLTGHKLEAWKNCGKAIDDAMSYPRHPRLIAFRRYDCTGGESFFGKLDLVCRIGDHNYYALPMPKA